MNEEELNRVKLCIYNIADKLNAIRIEINGSFPNKNYALEKLKPIKNDVECLISIFEKMDTDNYSDDDLPF